MAHDGLTAKDLPMSEHGENAQALRLCLIYAPEDQVLSADVKKSLKLLERLGLVSVWSMENILGGDETEKVLEQTLAEAHLIVYLLSKDFIASENYAGLSSSQVMERYRRGEVRL